MWPMKIRRKTVRILLCGLLLFGAGSAAAMWFFLYPEFSRLESLLISSENIHRELLRSTSRAKCPLHDSSTMPQQLSPFGDESLCQSDPELIRFIQKKYIVKPPVPMIGMSVQPSCWGHPATTRYSKFSIVEEKLIPLLFQDEDGKAIRGGTFLESGSLGSFLSATLYLERFLGWRGLIVEMAPVHIREIIQLKRYNSTLVPACASPMSYPLKTTYTTIKQEKVHPFATLLAPRHIKDGWTWANSTENLQIGVADCFPLFSILLAANFTKIDFANLSFGGMESDVLKTIPFQEVDIKVVLFSLANTEEEPQLIHKIMLLHGYIQVPPDLVIIRARDVAYVKRDWAIKKKLSFV